MQVDPIHVQCVYGASHVSHLTKVFIPALKKTTKRHIRLLLMNYDPHSLVRVNSEYIDGVDVVDVTNPSATNTGFGENHNTLFKLYPPSDCFVIINPDCIPATGSIDALLTRKVKNMDKKKVAIVEGRQWPFEHPKEYDPLTLHTPWASGAFLLVDSEFYKQIGGMDEIYFLYLEDVDLSWQAWLNGYTVIYEPSASTVHFSGGRFYRLDLVYHEHYLGLRNFLVISKKFFGEKGEVRALAILKKHSDQMLVERAIQEYLNNFQPHIKSIYNGIQHPNVKILGLNQFHEMRVAV